MAKYAGDIGFATLTEIRKGVTVESITPRRYRGDLIKNSRRLQSSGQALDDLSLANEISIVADPYARENFHMIRYAVFMGSKWKVTNVTVQEPRLILTLGGVYNGD